jgi:hypothetical protein
MPPVVRPHRALLALAVLLAAPGAGVAGPVLYLDTFVVSTSREECLRDMRRMLEEAGLSARITPVTFTDARGSRIQDGWDAHHPRLDLSASVKCVPTDETGALGVSGRDPQATWHLYGELHRRLQKL